MRRNYIIGSLAMMGLTALMTGCMEYPGPLYHDDPVAEERAKQYFGDSVDVSQSWSMISNSKVAITVNADLDNISKVQILTDNPYATDSARVLISTSAKAGDVVTLAYDYPKAVDKLYAACVNDEGYMRLMPFYPGDTNVDFVNWPEDKQTRVTAADYNGTVDINGITQPTTVATPKIANEGQLSDNYMFCTDQNLQKRSLSNIQNYWHDADGKSYVQDYLYTTALTTTSTERQQSEADEITNVIKKNFPENTNKQNMEASFKKIKESDNYIKNNNCVVTTTENRYVTVSPFHVAAAFANWESLYYYYYPVSALDGKTPEEQRVYLRHLPKYKAFDLKEDFTGTDEWWKNNASKDGQTHWGKTYRLAYFGDELHPAAETAGKYEFPANYRVGFMLRVDILDDPRSKYYFGNDAWYMAGNLYTDNLNDGPNHQNNNGYIAWSDGNYETFNMGSRAAMYSYNGHNYLCFEDEKDHDFNDLIFEVNGVKGFEEKKEVDYQVNTYIFEDRETGDYDMNDVVLKAQRTEDPNYVKFTVAAVGASDNLYLKGINGTKINGNTELHTLFPDAKSRAINVSTNEKDYVEPCSEVVYVGPNFDFQNSGISLYNGTTKKDVNISVAGDDPHGLCVADDFKYPTEGVCIKEAYPEFTSWAANRDNSKNWYLKANSFIENLFKLIFSLF